MGETKAVRARILHAAERRMIKFGYRKVTMDEIAADLGMSKNTIYKHFQSKEQIAKALVRRLQQQVDEGLVRAGEGKDPLRVFSASVLLMRKKLRPWFEHFFREIPVELPEVWDEFTRYRNERILDIRSVVEKGIKKGVFRKLNASVAVQAYLGAVKSILSPKFLDEEGLSFDQALDEILDIWSHGLCKKGGAR